MYVIILSAALKLFSDPQRSHSESVERNPQSLAQLSSGLDFLALLAVIILENELTVFV
jgi:hypothetical protein